MYQNDSYPSTSSASALTSCLAGVYWWMTLALVISGLAAWGIGTSPELSKVLIRHPFLMFILLIAEIGFVFWITAGIKKMAAATAAALFIAYSVLNGITLSFIFMTYSLGSITAAFCTTAGTFAVMALYGTVTKQDLTRLGNILLMGLIGLIIASIVNIFWTNSLFTLIVSCAGVLVFVGLTAYDAQKIKTMYLQAGTDDSETVRKIAVLGALTLYLDFINLFLYILRIFGRRD